jgi:glycosyltransferase involved in cell wall biosynthesis
LAFDITHYQSVERPNGANPVVGLFGSMTWPPTRRAAERFLSRLWPEIRRQAPYAEALIAGIGAREQLERFLEMPGVRIVEDVPDMRPYFERTTVLLYPATRATGIKVKVLEALAYGVPTVTTAEGAEGIPIEDGAHALLAESDEALVEHTLCLLRSTDRRDALRARGRALLRDEYRLDSTVEKLEGVYRAIGARRG